ncbi:hypothetical protein [Candidatus Uabimicrobium amorphum]|uniref:Uncharacterized protein n=1 Tax=Uabimicrobium amorphum TaxID=2596890 RepID=A0A5S9ITV6_UABAM|nr:hypothetical protein [Candidatus Uabimicrobium amorphum]BBM87090.1 hypothetical protein UABAM_05493 [Candidatus Uabimicrobium amorphum]
MPIYPLIYLHMLFDRVIPPLSENIQSSETKLPDLNQLAEMPSDYLIQQRIENLREKIDKSFEEVLELKRLENKYGNKEIGHKSAPTKTQHFISALEEKRTGIYKNQQYDGENSLDTQCSVNRYYMSLFNKSYLNVKSFVVLSKESKPLYVQTESGKSKQLTIFDLFATNNRKLGFEEYLAMIWDTDENTAKAKLQNISSSHAWQLKKEWQSYLDDIRTSRQSPYQKLLILCKDIITSPIFKDMQKLEEDTYLVRQKYRMRFTDKTAVFTIPMSEFEGIPQNVSALNPTHISFAMVLPKCAQEKKRFFRKGGCLNELINFVAFTGYELPEKWCNFLQQLKDNQFMRIYHENLEYGGKRQIRGYFINIKDVTRQTEKGRSAYPKEYLYRLLRKQLQQENCIVKEVSHLHEGYPEWMRKIGGLLVEEKHGLVMEQTLIVVDPSLPQTTKHQKLLLPSYHLQNSHFPVEQFRTAYVNELRQSYQHNPKLFEQYAFNVCRSIAVLKCSCKGSHNDCCTVPVLHKVFRKIYNQQ